MARVKITEYRTKKLILGDNYHGMSFRKGTKLPKRGSFVAKVDQGIKKRFKQGLVAVNQSPRAIPSIIKKWEKKGFSQFLLEPFFPHTEEEERYLSLERVRGGIQLLSSQSGGIDIEAHPESIKKFLIDSPTTAKSVAEAAHLPEKFLTHLLDVFEKNFFSFLEINPLIIRGAEAYLLDAAALVDSAGASFVKDEWTEADIVEAKSQHPIEEVVHTLQKTTPASLKLTVMNPHGNIFFLLSGGGGSIVIADEAHLKGVGKLIGNYGEYSGGPTREETHLYAREILRLLLEARPKQSKKRALVIAGGVANFTDIKSTFAGIIDAFEEVAPKLRAANVKVFIRRGGPNEKAGLHHMEEFLKKEKLFGSAHGSDAPITIAIDEAIKFVRS